MKVFREIAHVLFQWRVILSAALLQAILLSAFYIWKNFILDVSQSTSWSFRDVITFGAPFSLFLAILSEIWKISSEALENSRCNSDLIEKNSKTSKNNHDVLKEVNQRVDKLEIEVELAQPVIEMLRSTNRHQRVVQKLIEDMLSERRRHIPNSSKGRYWQRLSIAIADSNQYFGIRRDVIGTMSEDEYGTGEAAMYLQALKQKEMDEKIRIFVIDDDQISKMQNQVSDPRVLNDYFYLNGDDVETYWLTVSEVKNFGWERIPKDCGIYDKEIQIEFVKGNDQPGVLIFSQIEENGSDNAELRLFNELRALNGGEPFKPITPPQIEDQNG